MQHNQLSRLGKALQIQHMLPMGMEPDGLADYLSIPVSQVRSIMLGSRSIDRQLATTFAELFHTSVKYWLDLQDDLGPVRDTTTVRRQFTLRRYSTG